MAKMVDQSFCFVDGIAKNVPIQIDDHFIPTDFLVIDMGEDEYDPPIILGRPFQSTTKAIIYLATGEVHFQFPSEKVRRYFNNNYIVNEEPKKNRTRRRRRNCTHDEDIIGSKMTMPTTSIPKVQPFYMRLIIDAFDELMLHHDVCSFSFSEFLTWIKGMFDCIWKAWKVNEVDWGPNPSIPNILR
jgi:hypothetical protein